MSQPFAPTPVPSERDGGFTLVEVLLAMLISGVLVASLAAAISVVIRTTPTGEDRIDDARSTRSLSTFLAQDTTSAPPFLPEGAEGGFNVSTAADPDNNDCGAEGTNIVHLQWTETIVERRTFVANYRFVIDDGAGKVLRVTCWAVDGDPYGAGVSMYLTPKLDPTSVPVASLTFDDDGNVDLMSFTLTGRTGETVLVEVASRNPSEFFPS